jgi:hypothetical protein
MSKLQEKLKNANTLNQVIEVVNQEYNLDQKLGIMSKLVVVQGLTKMLDTLKVPKRVNIK